MKFHVITLFSDLIQAALPFGVVGTAFQEGKISVSYISPREFTSNVHQTVDDRPFGGGDGMVMLAEPLAAAMEKALAATAPGAKVRRLHFSPRGQVLDDAKVRELATYDELILVSSRYAGVDQRFLNSEIDEEISLGDYVLSGGELGVLVLIDALTRLIPGVLGNGRSATDESFSETRCLGLEEPQFTRPREWRGKAVPAELLSGHHLRMEAWKSAVSLLVTLDRRADLLGTRAHKDLSLALKVLSEMSDDEVAACGLSSREKVLADLQQRISAAASRPTAKK